jgi:hypothetical protein
MRTHRSSYGADSSLCGPIGACYVVEVCTLVYITVDLFRLGREREGVDCLYELPYFVGSKRARDIATSTPLAEQPRNASVASTGPAVRAQTQCGISCRPRKDAGRAPSLVAIPRGLSLAQSQVPTDETITLAVLVIVLTEFGTVTCQPSFRLRWILRRRQFDFTCATQRYFDSYNLFERCAYSLTFV